MAEPERLDQRIQLVASKEFNQKVDAWRRTQEDLPSRSEAIRRLVYQGLVHEEHYPMRLITAIIRPHKYEAVREALSELGVTGITAMQVTGFGRQRGQTEVYRGAEYEVKEIPKVRIEVAVPSTLEESALNCIAEHAETGKIGDGKIFVTPVTGAMRIRTGERDDKALS